MCLEHIIMDPGTLQDARDLVLNKTKLKKVRQRKQSNERRMKRKRKEKEREANIMLNKA